jgi:hypothetical protein
MEGNFIVTLVFSNLCICFFFFRLSIFVLFLFSPVEEMVDVAGHEEIVFTA